MGGAGAIRKAGFTTELTEGHTEGKRKAESGKRKAGHESARSDYSRTSDPSAQSPVPSAFPLPTYCGGTYPSGLSGPSPKPSAYHASRKPVQITKKTTEYGIISEIRLPSPASFWYF